MAQPVPVPFTMGKEEALYPAPQQDLALVFAENFTGLQGRFSFCSSYAELVAQLNQLADTRNWQQIYCREEGIKHLLASAGFMNYTATALHDCDASITTCELLVARTGSILMSSAQQSGRTTSVYAPVHICIAYMSQLVYDIKDGLQLLKDKYADAFPSLITLATGPSRTADIEKTLVVGVHGPKEVFCFLIDDSVTA